MYVNSGGAGAGECEGTAALEPNCANDQPVARSLRASLEPLLMEHKVGLVGLFHHPEVDCLFDHVMSIHALTRREMNNCFFPSRDDSLRRAISTGACCCRRNSSYIASVWHTSDTSKS